LAVSHYDHSDSDPDPLVVGQFDCGRGIRAARLDAAHPLSSPHRLAIGRISVNNISKLLGAAALFAALSHVGAMAADYKVLMKGTGSQPMRFEPDFLKIAAGDTVTFVPEDAGHNVTSIDGLAPEGTEWWGGKRDQQLTVTFWRGGSACL